MRLVCILFVWLHVTDFYGKCSNVNQRKHCSKFKDHPLKSKTNGKPVTTCTINGTPLEDVTINNSNPGSGSCESFPPREPQNARKCNSVKRKIKMSKNKRKRLKKKKKSHNKIRIQSRKRVRR
ncbi:hypothetical protein MAR_022761 [Mya arenaria]|uniref:Secreted protein n=1 Tax=Mya arenaria TaxID=6604 RepID=A0ABY7DMJ8_MYAAR|nr:hypothetical protein MAR_022761 [Mya arenaria]